MSDRQSVELVWMLLIILLCFAFSHLQPGSQTGECGASVNMDGRAW